MLGRLFRIRTPPGEKKGRHRLFAHDFGANLSLVTTVHTANATASPDPWRERAVHSIGRALAVVPSLGPARAAWTRLGFHCSNDFVYQGCRAFDVQLAEGGIRILRPDRGLPGAELGAAAARKLEIAAGLIGWTWACRDPHRTRHLIESASQARFAVGSDGRDSLIVPRELTAGAITLLEEFDSSQNRAVHSHPNTADHIDHLVLMVGDADAAAELIGRAFRLTPKARDLKTSRYAFCKVGASVLEIVGPPQPEKKPRDGTVWGITFGVRDVDRAIAEIRARGIEMPDAHDAIQGGRIVGVPKPVGGIQVAFMGT